MFKIQTGIPMPPVERAPQARKYPLPQMQVGEFFFVPESDSRKLSTYLSRVTKELHSRFSTRHMWAVRDADGDWHPCKPNQHLGAVEGTGVWRIA